MNSMIVSTTRTMVRTMSQGEAQRKVDAINNRLQWFYLGSPEASKAMAKFHLELLDGGWDVKEVTDESYKAGFYEVLDGAEILEDVPEEEEE